MADDAAAAGAVDDIDRLLQLLFEFGRDVAGDRVGAAAGAPRHDQGDRPLGPGRKRWVAAVVIATPSPSIAAARPRRVVRGAADWPVLVCNALRGGVEWVIVVSPVLLVADTLSASDMLQHATSTGVRLASGGKPAGGTAESGTHPADGVSSVAIAGTAPSISGHCAILNSKRATAAGAMNSTLSLSR